MSVNGASNNIFIKPYEQYELKTYAQNNVDNPIISAQAQVDTFQRGTQDYQETETQNTSSLREELEQQKKDQGIISKAWDGIKNFFGAKNSSSNVEKTIEKFENGEISEEEARQALDEYRNAQSTFTDKLSGIISTAGLIGTVAGAVLSFIPGGQVIGLPLLAISGKVALGGMFVDNALDLVDNSTDKDGLTKDELEDLVIETGVEAVSYMVGCGIGKLTGNIHANIANKLVSKGTSKIASQVIGYAGEAVTDGALSLGVDCGIAQVQSLITTGETIAWDDYWSIDRFTSEGRSQLIGILTGVAASKQYLTSTIAPATAGIGVASKGAEAEIIIDNTPLKSPIIQNLNNLQHTIKGEKITASSIDEATRIQLKSLGKIQEDGVVELHLSDGNAEKVQVYVEKINEENVLHVFDMQNNYIADFYNGAIVTDKNFTHHLKQNNGKVVFGTEFNPKKLTTEELEIFYSTKLRALLNEKGQITLQDAINIFPNASVQNLSIKLNLSQFNYPISDGYNASFKDATGTKWLIRIHSQDVISSKGNWIFRVGHETTLEAKNAEKYLNMDTFEFTGNAKNNGSESSHIPIAPFYDKNQIILNDGNAVSYLTFVSQVANPNITSHAQIFSKVANYAKNIGINNPKGSIKNFRDLSSAEKTKALIELIVKKTKTDDLNKLYSEIFSYN